MALDVLVSIQKYTTVILLFIAAFIWLLLRKNHGEEGLKSLKINRAYTSLVLIVLPFVVGTFSVFSDKMSLVGQSFLTTLIFLSFFVILFKLNRKNYGERIKDLKDLMDESKKSPIRYEFARSLIAPELKKLKVKEFDMEKKEKDLKSKGDKQAKELKIKEKKLDKKITKFVELKADNEPVAESDQDESSQATSSFGT